MQRQQMDKGRKEDGHKRQKAQSEIMQELLRMLEQPVL